MIQTIRRVGLYAKGGVYIMVGLLTAAAALFGGQEAGKSSVIDFLETKPLGNALLIALGVGILGYTVWRYYAAFTDAKGDGDDAAAIAWRAFYLLTGTVYAAFAYKAISTALGSSSSSGGDTKQSAAATLIDTPVGVPLLVAIGLAVAGYGVYQAYRSFTGDYLKRLTITNGDNRELVRKSGRIGYVARAVVFLIIGWFVIRAGVTKTPEMIRGTKGAFEFLHGQSYGTVLLLAAAIGLAAYGLFCIYLARHSDVRG